MNLLLISGALIKRKATLLILVLVIAIAGGYFAINSFASTTTNYSCLGRQFYIDYSSGSDSNNGTSKSSPWKRSPGMAGFVGTYTHQSHDCFYFKGGVTWPRTVLPLTIEHSGDAASKDYYGADTSWYNGTQFTQPVFDAQNANISSSRNIMIDAGSADYYIIDNIKLDNFTASNYTGTYGTCELINALGAQNVIIDHITGSNQKVDFASDNTNPCSSVLGATYGSFQGNSVVQNSSFYGASTTTSSAGGGILCFGNVKNTVMHDLTGMIFPCGHGEISGNLLYNCGYPNFPAGSKLMHADAIQVDLADGAYYIHDNVIHDTGVDDANGNECESMFIGNQGETDYVYNNVLYNLHGNSPALTQNQTPGVAAYFYNNTIVSGRDGNEYCIRQGHTGNYNRFEARNNHCMTNFGGDVDPTITATAKVVDHNITQTINAASSAGYSTSQSYVFSPTSSSSPTVGVGANLTSICTGLLSGLCSDTNYANTRTAISRPDSNWNIGAYEYSSNVSQVCSSKQGDANNDNAVNILDISAILSNYGKTGTTLCSDVNKDGSINIQDISLVLSKYGT